MQSICNHGNVLSGRETTHEQCDGLCSCIASTAPQLCPAHTHGHQ